MKQLLSLIVFVCCSLSAAAGVYNVRDYGAKGDGKALDSPAQHLHQGRLVIERGGQLYTVDGKRLMK